MLAFDPDLVFKLWLTGPLTLGLGHRLYMRDWRGGAGWLLLRLCSLNFLLVGWAVDGGRLEQLNKQASKVEQEMKMATPKKRLAHLREERARVA